MSLSFMQNSKIALLFFSSILLGIWALKETVALRNILILLCFFLSISYFCSLRKDLLQFFRRLYSQAPFYLVLLLFAWILTHYFFIGEKSNAQAEELRSTWTRGFLVWVVGIAVGRIIADNIKYTEFLFLGILISFYALILQYIPKSIADNSIFSVHHYEYIYLAKINPTLAGSMLLASCGSLLFNRDLPRSSNFSIFLKVVFLIAPVLYSYVFILDARNGMAIFIILLFTWFLYWNFCFKKYAGTNLEFKNILLIFFCVLITCIFYFKHYANNPGWSTFIQDFLIASNIKENLNWINPMKYGYPSYFQGGGQVNPNNYERISWFIVGLQLIGENIWGTGILQNSFHIILSKIYLDVGALSTHSAWIDFTLALGVPGLLFMISPLLICIVSALKNDGVGAPLIVSLSVALIVVYLVGELATKHGPEILLFSLGFLCTLRAYGLDFNKNLKISKAHNQYSKKHFS